MRIDVDVKKLQSFLSDMGIYIKFNYRPDNSVGDGGEEWSPTEEDMRGLIELLVKLEARMPFVGVGYLLNKMVHSGLAEGQREAREWFNSLIKEGIISTSKVENKDPNSENMVTACVLNREHDKVCEFFSEFATNSEE